MAQNKKNTKSKKTVKTAEEEIFEQEVVKNDDIAEDKSNLETSDTTEETTVIDDIVKDETIEEVAIIEEETIVIESVKKINTDPFIEKDNSAQALKAANPMEKTKNKKPRVMIAFDEWNGTYIM